MGQEPAEKAATRIADAAQPTTTLFADVATCLSAATAVLPSKDAAKFCLEARKLEVKRGTKVANEAADATKNNWPKPSPVYAGYGGWGYSGGFYGDYGHRGGWGWTQGGAVVTSGDGHGNVNTTFHTGGPHRRW